MSTILDRVHVDQAKDAYESALADLEVALTENVDGVTARNMADDVEAKRHTYRSKLIDWRIACGFYRVAA